MDTNVNPEWTIIKKNFDEMNICKDDRSQVPVMYLVVRKNLNMSPGKIAAQVGHAVMQLSDLYYRSWLLSDSFSNVSQEEEDTYIEWRKSPTKVVLGANEEEWENIKKLHRTEIVIDGGFTEIPANTETVIGLWPVRKHEAPEIIKSLKTL